MDFLEAEKIPFEVINYTQAGDPMLLIRKQGHGRPVMITAGAHANEPSGVSAALALARDWAFDFPLVMMPLRDPMGCRPYAANLSRALGREVVFSDSMQLSELLLQNADVVYCNDGNFQLVEIGGVLFNNFRQAIDDMDAYLGEVLTNAFMKEHPELLSSLAGKRLVSKPNSTPRAETVGQYGRSFVGYINAFGLFCNMNRRFGREDAPVEIKSVQRVFDATQPQFVLDLHEGFGSTYYMFNANYGVSDRAKVFAAAMSKRLAEVGEPTHAADIAKHIEGFTDAYFEPVPGVIADVHFGNYDEQGSPESQSMGLAFGAYCAMHGCPSFTIEAGNNAPMAARVNVQITGALAALEALVGGA